MTKEEFKKKYHGDVISVMYPIVLGSFNNAEKEVSVKVNQLKNCCQELDLKVVELPEPATVVVPKKLFAITDPDNYPLPYHSMPKEATSIEEFLEDFGHYVEEEQRAKAVKVLDILSGMKINNVDIKHVGASLNMKQLAEDGFIQGYTSNEASLWWNPNGKRILFVRGEGAFSITDKVEENA